MNLMLEAAGWCSSAVGRNQTLAEIQPEPAGTDRSRIPGDAAIAAPPDRYKDYLIRFHTTSVGPVLTADEGLGTV